MIVDLFVNQNYIGLRFNQTCPSLNFLKEIRMSKLIICSGPAGTGKSTLAKDIVRALHSQGKVCQIFSTDSFWIRPSGTYDFSPRLLEEAHNWNLEKFKSFLEDSDFQKVDCTAIIDNTN